jgi:hypothetical protein
LGQFDRMSVGKPFRYLFFVIHQWNENHSIRGSTINGAAGTVSLLTLNVFLGLQLMLLFHVTNFATQMLKLDPRLTAIIIFIPIYGIVWRLFVANGSYKNFGTEFDSTSARRIRVRRVMFITYVVLTICAPLVLKTLIHAAPR